MILSDENIRQFQILYKKRFGIEITKEEASEKGRALVQLMSVIYKPITKKDYAKYSKKILQV